MRGRACLPWIAVLLLFVGVRSLAGWPRGVDRDENQDAWNARCLAEGGTDFQGHAWPLILVDYGDDKHALYAWLLAGLDKLGIEARPDRSRVFSAVLVGVGAVLAGLAFALHTGSQRAGLLLALALAFLPWFQVGPCLGWECATSPPGYGAMLLGLALAGRGRRLAGSALFVAGLALAVYGYPAAKVLAPALLLGGALALGASAWQRGLVALVGVAALLPLALDNLLHPEHTDRARGLLVSDASTIARQWLTHWSPSFLLWRGDPMPRHFAGWLGVLPLGLAGGLLIGGVLRLRAGRPWTVAAIDRFVLLGVLLFPLPAAITSDGNGHVLRSLLGGFALTWLGGLGLRRLARLWPAVAATLVVAVGLQCAAHLWHLSRHWRTAQPTFEFFHGELWSDLFERLPPLRPARVFFSPEPVEQIETSAFPLVHFGWTALGSRPIPGQMHAHVPGHLATRGRPEVDVWLGQAATVAGPDVVLQRHDRPAPAGFERLDGIRGEMQLWVRPAATQ